MKLNRALLLMCPLALVLLLRSAPSASGQIGPGGALNFNGTDQRVVVAPQAALNAYPLTVMTWFKSATTNLGGALVNKYVASSFNGYQLFMGGGHLQAWYIRDSGNNVFNGGPMDAGVVDDGVWHHAALVIYAFRGAGFLGGGAKKKTCL